MARNKVVINGETYIDLTDTTAEASDVASGKYFYSAAGVRTAGTSSGGGASNVVEGTFTCSSTTGTTQTITIPYTGSGYPIACMVFVSGGAYNSAVSEWYNSTQRYAIGQWTMHKAVQTSSPTYSTSGNANYGVTAWIYKNSTSTSTSYSRSSAMNTNTFTASSPSAAGATCVRFRSSTQMQIFVASSSYGLMAGLEYQYIVIYSS